QRAERQRYTPADPVAADVDQLERAAAEVADDAVRLVNTGDDAERRQMRLARAGQDLDFHPADLFGLGDELGAVRGVAAGRCCDRMDAADLHDPAQRAKSPE